MHSSSIQEILNEKFTDNNHIFINELKNYYFCSRHDIHVFYGWNIFKMYFLYPFQLHIIIVSGEFNLPISELFIK